MTVSHYSEEQSPDFYTIFVRMHMTINYYYYCYKNFIKKQYIINKFKLK